MALGVLVGFDHGPLVMMGTTAASIVLVYTATGLGKGLSKGLEKGLSRGIEEFVVRMF